MDSIVIFCAKYLFVFVILIFIYTWMNAGKYRKQMAAALVLAGLLAVIMSKIASELFYNPRPFVTQNITPLVNHAKDNGFPSEHTLYSVTIAAVLFFYRPKLSYLAFGAAILVGAARVAADVHSPLDIVGGVFFGISAAWLGYVATKSLFAKRKPTKHHAGR